MSKRKVFVVKSHIENSTRSILLRMFPPSHEHVYCRGVTYLYGVDQTFSQFPRHDVSCEIIGRHTTAEHEALICHLEGLHRPDGKLFHITLSTAPGVAPARSAEIDDDLIVACDPVVFQVTFGLEPARQIPPQLRSELRL